VGAEESPCQEGHAGIRDHANHCNGEAAIEVKERKSGEESGRCWGGRSSGSSGTFLVDEGDNVRY
jgi:hypothetical protein